MASEEPFIPLTDLERRFEWWRVRIGLVLAPIVFIGIWLTSWSTPGGTDGSIAPILSPQAHHLAAIMAAVVVLWLSEAIPMPVTALLGAACCVLFRVADSKDVFSPFADQLMFLFVGSFIIARAIFIQGLDRRLAYGVMGLKFVGARPGRILFAFGAVTAFISAWISNTATTAMMLAIGVSILKVLFEQEETRRTLDRRYATGLALMTSFAASIGGLATPIGTPPNIIGLRYIRENLHVEIPFLKWTAIGVPVVCVLFLFLYFYLNWACPAGMKELPGSRELIRRKKQELGPWTRGQISTLVAFGITVCMWVLPGVAALIWGETSSNYEMIRKSLPEGGAALLGAGLLFLLPGESGKRVISWEQAAQIDWGVVLLYGGGFALGELSNKTGLADVVGHGLSNWLPFKSELALLIGGTFVAALVSEATSNTTSANIVVLLVIKMAEAAGVDPLAPALGATFGVSLGFMLPVSTPCNAIVYGTGYVPLSRMVKYGVALDIAGVVVIVVLVKLLLPFIR